MLRIKQFYYPQGQEDETLFGEGEWSKNLIENQLCYTLGIHSLPGNKFQINDNSVIVINGTGNFSMDFNAYPINSIRIHKDNNYETYQTVIDIVYQQYEGVGVHI